MSSDELKFFGYILLSVGAGVTFIVTLFYGIVAPWHKTPSGRYIFTLLLSLTLVLCNSVVRIFFREWTFGIILGIVLFCFYIIAISAVGIGIYNASIKRYLDIKINKVKAK